MPGGGPSAASSLYSGIFSAEAGNSSSSDVKDKGVTPQQVQEEETSTTSTSDSSAAPPKPQAWSAALRFAPRKNVNVQANKARRPPASALVHSGFSSAPILGEDESSASSEAKIDQSPPTAVVASSSREWTSPQVKSKEIVKTDALRISTREDDAVTRLPRVVAPPELSISVEELEKDKALFASLAEKRGEKKSSMQHPDRDWQENAEDEDVNGFGNTKEGRKAKKKKHKRKRDGSPGVPAASLRMDADYDVRVPNDYNEFKNLVRSRREAVKQVARAQQREEALKSSRGYLRQREDDYESGSDGDEDESYRRSKMGRFAPPATYHQADEDRQPSIQSPFDDDDDDEKPYLSPPLPATFDRTSPPTLSTSGEEAYQRRLAMPQLPSSAGPTGIETEEIPATPSVVDVAAKAALAASIAARLAKAAPSQAAPILKSSAPSFVSSSSTNLQNSASFAEKLMEKQGWKKGEALGVEGNKGLLDPILAEKVEAERRKHSKAADRSLHSNRGTLVNAREDDKRREEREKFGTPSEVILLENMVDLADVDDDLNGEIGEECSKHGYVQRVFVWPHGPEGVRIFVKFSGMAGAWRCVKELEGRFFGGKTVRARYYPLIDYERGDYMKSVQ